MVEPFQLNLNFCRIIQVNFIITLSLGSIDVDRVISETML